MSFLFISLFSFSAYAGFSEMPESNRYQYLEKPREEKERVQKVVVRQSSMDRHAQSLLEQDRKILKLLERQEKRVIVKKRVEKITALTRVKGILLNSVLAMNVKPSKFIVRITGDHPELEGAELRCQGFSFEKRVPSQCDLMVLHDSEFQVDVDIWDVDGAEGIIADYFYSGEEKTFLTSSFASFLGATFEVAKGGVNSPFGTVSQNTAKNKIMDGLSKMAGNAKDKIIESGEQNLTISYVNSGKEVLVFFNESIKLNGGE
ncbi:MAG: hypothetical protein CMJ16_08870 [Peredibacter sp.]|nr:hypothetical protein [Peredibacter sp.]